MVRVHHGSLEEKSRMCGAFCLSGKIVAEALNGTIWPKVNGLYTRRRAVPVKSPGRG
jgi:hypothetical protein